MRWHLFRDVPRPGWANMAVDLGLLDRAEASGDGWLRLYGWAPSCLSFGRHEPAARRYERGRIAALGLDVVRRPTGGRAVWHARELTYAIAAPADRLGPLREAYAAIHRMLCDALRSLGVAATPAPAAGRALAPDAGACFARPAGGEVTVGDRKLVGSAQLRRGGALLQHGSILLGDDQAVVARVSRGAAPPARATSLADVTGRGVSPEEAAGAVAAAARRSWPGTWVNVRAADDALEWSRPHAELFRSDGWTWTR